MPNYVSKEAVTRDLLALNLFVERNHPNPFYTHSKSQVDAFYEVLTQDLADSISIMDCWKLSIKMINYFNDAHTRVRYLPFYNNYIKQGGLLFPLEVRFKENELIIYNDWRTDDTIPVGTKITAINGWLIGDLKKELCYFARGENQEVDLLQINQSFYYYLWLATGWGAQFDLELVSPDGNTSKMPIKGITLDQLKKARGDAPPREEIVAWEMLNDSVAYLYIRNFYSAGKKGYKNRFDDVFRQLKQESKAKYLIIDNRNNDGGDDIYAEYLCRYFADQPFRSVENYYWYVTPRFKKTFKKSFIPGAVRWMRPMYFFNPHTRAIWNAKDSTLAKVKKKYTKPFKAKKQFNGKVIMMNDVGTFSAGSMFAAMFKDFEMGTTIGRPTGNISSFFANDIIRGSLSRSRIPIEVSTSYNVRPNGDESLKSIQPDIYVPEGKNILEFTLQWITNEKAKN